MDVIPVIPIALNIVIFKGASKILYREGLVYEENQLVLLGKLLNTLTWRYLNTVVAENVKEWHKEQEMIMKKSASESRLLIYWGDRRETQMILTRLS